MSRDEQLGRVGINLLGYNELYAADVASVPNLVTLFKVFQVAIVPVRMGVADDAYSLHFFVIFADEAFSPENVLDLLPRKGRYLMSHLQLIIEQNDHEGRNNSHHASVFPRFFLHFTIFPYICNCHITISFNTS